MTLRRKKEDKHPVDCLCNVCTVARLAQKHKGWTIRQAHDAQVAKPVISTGCWAVDIALGRRDPQFGNGGFAARSFAEVCGETTVGKSAFARNVLLQVERRGMFGVILMAEENAYANFLKMGINPDAHLILPTYEAASNKDPRQFAEERFADICDAVRSPNCGCYIIDAVKSLASKIQAYEKGKVTLGKIKGFDKKETAPRANFMEKLFNRIKRTNENAFGLFLNHQYPGIGPDYRMDASAKPITPGGNRLHFESLVRVSLKSTRLKAPEHHLIERYRPTWGLKTYFDIFKNRFSGRWGYRSCQANYIFERDPYLISPSEYNNEVCVFEHGVDIGIIHAEKAKRGGIWYDLGGGVKGRDAALQYLITHYDEAFALYLELVKRHDDVYAPAPGTELADRQSRANLQREGLEADPDEENEDDDDED